MEPPRHVLESRFVGLFVGNKGDWRIASSPVLNDVRQRFDRNFFVGSYVDDLADRSFGVEKADHRLDTVPNIAKASRLLARAINRNRFPVERLLHEVRKHHAIAACLTRPDGIEESGDLHGLLSFLPVRKSQEFIESLRRRVAPACLRGRSQDEVRIFMEGHFVAFAIHFGRRRDEDELLLLRSGIENELRAMDVGLERSHGAFDDQPHANGRSQVHHDVGFIDQLGQELFVPNRIEEILKPVICLEMADVLYTSGREIIQDEDIPSAAKQRLRQMRTDEPSPASYEIAHDRSLVEESLDGPDPEENRDLFPTSSP